MMHPLCEVCISQGIISPAEDVHHDKSFITDAGVDYNLAYSIDNLISLCKKCHSMIHSKEGKTQGGLKEGLSQG
jgi:5-methylcytosine-specific restriction protein A